MAQVSRLTGEVSSSQKLQRPEDVYGCARCYRITDAKR